MAHTMGSWVGLKENSHEDLLKEPSLNTTDQETDRV